MHTYLRSIGFKDCQKEEIEQIVCTGVTNALQDKNVVYCEDKKKAFTRVECGKEFGISVVCDISDGVSCIVDHYMPYVIAKRTAHVNMIYADKHSYNDSYGFMTDDIRIGNTVVGTFENAYCYSLLPYETNQIEDVKIGLSGFSIDGVIILPVIKEPVLQAELDNRNKSRAEYQLAARNGDEEAMEYLALDDMDMFNSVTRRVAKEDIYSIVESTFIPCGVECDNYSVLGTIIDVQESINMFTAQTVYNMEIECNDMFLNVIINKEDLKGEPLAGRRFKGHIWLSGRALR